MSAVTEPVIGLRCFRARPDGTLISPIIDGISWQVGCNEARCIKHRFWQPWKHEGPAPVGNCTCGIYAHHEVVKPDGDGVWGVVRGWGRVEVHPDGWRAQYAELLAVFKHNQKPEVLEAISRKYSVPIMPLNYVKPEFLEAEFGPFVPKEIRPQSRSDRNNDYMVADYCLWATVGAVTLGTIGLGVIREWRQVHT